MIQKSIERVKQMELYFDVLQKAVKENPAAIRENAVFKAILRHITEYYESKEWLQDYELDEKGLLPPDLKRGILAQDTLFDFLEYIQSIE